jgi:hypothetical protein
VTRILVLLAVVAAAVWAGRSWRRGLEAALILLVFEGAIRKWVVPAASSYVYFAKDVLLLGVYWGYLRERRGASLVPQPLVMPIVFALGVGLMQIFNPRLPSPLVGVLGFKAYFLYLPLLWVVPAAFRTEDELLRFLKRYLWLAVPIGLLAVMQFFSPADSRWNTYARTTVDTPMSAITFGAVDRVRVTGTFSFITGYGSFLQVVSLLALTLLSVGQWRVRGNLQTYLALSLTVLGMLMTGSRGPVFILLLTLPIYWVLGIARSGGVPAAARFLLGLGLVAALVNVVGADAVSAFRARAAGSDDVTGRIFQPFINPARLVPEVGVLGYGIGATHQMAEVLSPSIFAYSWLDGLHFEDEPSRVMVELGALGFLAWFGARLALVFVAFRAVYRLRRPFPRAVALSALLLLLSQITGGVVFNVTGGLYYWFFGGLLFLAIRLDREAARVPAAPSPVGQRPHRRAIPRLSPT